jgi:hypothetical protein
MLGARLPQRQAQQAPQAPVIVGIGPDGPVIRAGGAPSANATYEALRNSREELGNQLDRLENQRENLVEELAEPTATGAVKQGIEARIATIDARIGTIDKQIADADAAVARAAAVPGAVVPPPPEPPEPGPPEEFWVIAGIFMFVVVLPLTIAYARRIWRRGAAAITSLPQDIYDRFTRLEQGIDAIAVEVERIGEGQRFLTRLQTEQRGLAGGQPERVEARQREGERSR